jgi:signal transduction histidine kinase
LSYIPGPTSIETERKTTDDSQKNKREKNDDSMNEARGRTERRTDKFVLKERNQADQSFTEARIVADSNRALERLNLPADTNGDWKRSDEQLNGERQDFDRAVGLERARTDAALWHERDSKSALMTHMFEHEREQSDQHRSSERTRTDSAVEMASKLLVAEMEEHSKAKISITSRDEFLAIVSHDLRNPIGAVSACAGMLLDDPSFRGVTAEIRTYIQLMKRNADASLRLISDLLDMERVAEGKFELYLRSNSVSEIIHECIENFRHLVAAKSLTIVSDIVVGDDNIICDRDRVSQIITNLMGNAIKFTHVGGYVKVAATVSEAEILISIEDKGPGIPEEMQSQIFNRFAQLKSKDRTGLGLGLYISKMLVEAHGGRLWVKSIPGDGSTFYFNIPRTPAKHS